MCVVYCSSVHVKGIQLLTQALKALTVLPFLHISILLLRDACGSQVYV